MDWARASLWGGKALGLALAVLLASASSIRSILSLKPAEVLHGR